MAAITPQAHAPGRFFPRVVRKTRREMVPGKSFGCAIFPQSVQRNLGARVDFWGIAGTALTIHRS